MVNKLKKYNEKRNFKKTKEPIGKSNKSKKKLHFVVQHHIARRDHYDFRLEWDGVLKSWAVPKGPSYKTNVKRLAIMVEDHPLSYHNFEGTIPQGEYGGGTVMLWDEGYFEPIGDFETSLKKGSLKFILKGSRLKGTWTLIHIKENNWLLIKENDEFKNYTNINKFKTSIKTGRTMEEITNHLNEDSKNTEVLGISISSLDKIIFPKAKITKFEVIKYYEAVASRMLPLIKNRLISTVRCPEGIEGKCFFKKHLENKSVGIGKKRVLSFKGNRDDYYYIKDESGIISEAQMNSIEFHVWGSRVNSLNNPDMLVFDLDPDESLSLSKIRQGVKDLKSILDDLKLKSFLKTSGGKGYHVVVPINYDISWKEFRKVAKNIAQLMETKWPDKYVSNMRKEKRKDKIFIDWVRNTKGATSVAPYSLRARVNAPVSMPIKWSELDKVKPNEITIDKALERLKRVDPWKNFYD